MAVLARDEVTLASITDVQYMRRYYLLQLSNLAAPAVPTTNPPTGTWSTTEPTYAEGSTNSLYVTDLIVFSDTTFDYLPVQKSSSYEAAKVAYNKALAAENAAGRALETALSGNLQPNGDFANGQAHWSGWGTNLIEMDSSEGRRAAPAAKFFKTAGSSNNRHITGVAIPCSAGEKFQISGWYKSNESNSTTVANLGVRFNRSEGADAWTSRLFSVGTTEWTYKETIVVAPANATAVTVSPFLNGGTAPEGTVVWFDDIAIRRITDRPSANLITNPGFEEGENGWTGWVGSIAALETTRKRSGFASAKLYHSGSVGVSTTSIPVVPGDILGFSGWAQTSPSANGYVAITLAWRRADGTEFWTGSATKQLSEFDSSTWQRVIGSEVVPVDAVEVRVSYRNPQGGAPANHVVWWDDVEAWWIDRETYYAAQEAQAAAAAAQSTATTALTSANGSNAIIQSTDTASGTTHPTTGAALKTGDWWQQWDNTTNRNVIGLWRWSSSAWQAQTIAHQVISSLDVNKLVVSGAARITLAVIEKLVADVGFYQVLTTDVLYAGTANVDTLVAQKFATALADIITARVENLTVTTGANINSAVIQKIATELIVAEVLSTGIDPVTGWYAIMDSSGFRVIDSDGANEGAPEVLIHLGPDADQLIQLGTGRDKVSINSSGGGSFRRIDTQEFRLNGANLERLLESYPRGIVAFGQVPYGLSTVQRQGRAIILGVDANLTKGRVYTIRTNQMSLSRGASGIRPIPQLHMTLNGSDPSSNWNATAVAESPGIINIQNSAVAHPPMEAIVDLRNMTDDGETVLCRIAVTLNDQNNISWSQLSTGRGAFHCIVRDEGTALTDTGVAWLSDNATPPPAKTRYTKRYYANAIATYVRGGGRDDSSGAVQGKYSSWNRETYLFFPSMTSDLSGADVHSIKAFAWFDHWYNNAGGTGSWCWHGHTSVPSSGQYANYMRDEPNWARNSGREAVINPNEFNDWKNGTRRGVAFSTANTGLEFYGKLSTNLSAHWIDVEYSK